MSVPVYKRSESKTEYLNLLYDINVRIGEIVANGSNKYVHSYGDHLIKTGLEALKYCQIANRIFISKNMNNSDYLLRRSSLYKAIGLLDNISTSADIYLELSLKNSKISKKDILKRQEDIGNLCYKTIEKLKSVIKYDASLLKK